MKINPLSSRVSRLASSVGVASCRALLPLVLAAATGLGVLPAQAEMVKAIDMEHHFFHPAFIESLKTRTEYPLWKDGFGVMYSKSAALPIGPEDKEKILYRNAEKYILSGNR